MDDLEFFKRVFKHYMIQALAASGCHVDNLTHKDLNEACDRLFKAIRKPVSITTTADTVTGTVIGAKIDRIG